MKIAKILHIVIVLSGNSGTETLRHSPRVELESLSAILSVSLVSGLAATAVRRRISVTGDITGMTRTREQVFVVYVTD